MGGFAGMSQQGLSQGLSPGGAPGGLDMPLMPQMDDMSLMNQALPSGVGGEEGGAESTSRCAEAGDVDKLHAQN